MSDHTLTTQHLVLGAGGAQGGAIARELVKQGEKVRGLVRHADEAVPDGVEKIVADLADAAAVEAAFAGITHATITVPLVYDAAVVRGYARNIAAAAVKAGVKRLVYNANTRPPAKSTGVAAFDTRTETEDILRATGIPMVSLHPTVYLENLLSPGVKAGLQQHGALHYPLPAEMRVSWISHTDLAKAVCAAHRMMPVPDQAICIGGNAMSGSELAASLSRTMGRTLSFVPLDPAIFESSLVGFIGADAAAGVAGIYHWAFKNRESAILADGAAILREKFGVTPMTPEEWSAHHAWQ